MKMALFIGLAIAAILLFEGGLRTFAYGAVSWAGGLVFLSLANERRSK